MKQSKLLASGRMFGGYAILPEGKNDDREIPVNPASRSPTGKQKQQDPWRALRSKGGAVGTDGSILPMGLARRAQLVSLHPVAQGFLRYPKQVGRPRAVPSRGVERLGDELPLHLVQDDPP